MARLCKELGFEEVFAWNDMFDKTAVGDLRELGETPVLEGAILLFRSTDNPRGLGIRHGRVEAGLLPGGTVLPAGGRLREDLVRQRLQRSQRAGAGLHVRRPLPPEPQVLRGIVQELLLGQFSPPSSRIPPVFGRKGQRDNDHRLAAVQSPFAPIGAPPRGHPLPGHQFPVPERCPAAIQPDKQGGQGSVADDLRGNSYRSC